MKNKAIKALGELVDGYFYNVGVGKPFLSTMAEVELTQETHSLLVIDD